MAPKMSSGRYLETYPEATIATKVGIPGPLESVSGRGHLGTLYRRTLRPILGHFPAVKSRMLKAVRKIPTLDAPPIKRELSRATVLRELDYSLKRLRRTRVDLYMVHEPAQFEITDDLYELFLSLQRDGVIKAFGLAYGTLPPGKSPSFGSVEQCRYSSDLAPLGMANKMRIFHGVLRYGLSGQGKSGRRLNAGQLISSVLHDHGSSAVIVSASTTRQITQIAKQYYSAIESEDDVR